MSINKILVVILLGLFVSACAINEPRLSIGKKCAVKDNKVVYSYIWLYDKQVGLPADKKSCDQMVK
jgi:hypothetical protein|tara:strand:- start:557 stop:754 length:198 start_codon:yes stop_codon:yes gene_type:complete